jgi:pyridoxal phosphate enzyme (YggS family)
VSGIADVRERIGSAARRAGRLAEDVRLVGVSKTHPMRDLLTAFEAGLIDLGENRAQELAAKATDALWGSRPNAGRPRWHMIGQCQTNKVAMLAGHVTLWQSVDRVELIDQIARRSPGAALLLQVDTTGDPTRGGAPVGAVPALLEHARSRDLDVRGLMAMAPLETDPRPCFDLVSALAARLQLAECSIGMSDDFEVAIEHGATIVRVGRAIFGVV